MGVNKTAKFSEEGSVALANLASVCNLSEKDLINNAISLLKWAIEETAKGRSISSVDREAKSIIELCSPMLDAVQKHSKPLSLK